MNPALFVSDLHLSPARAGIAARFLRFVAEEARSASGLFIYNDTRLPGNRNLGHEYGTMLTAQEKDDLVAFLRTL